VFERFERFGSPCIGYKALLDVRYRFIMVWMRAVTATLTFGQRPTWLLGMGSRSSVA